MALYINCTSCHQPFKISEKAATRVDLEENIGEYFRKTCLHCCVENEYHINDVTAASNNSIKLIAAGTGLAIIILVTLFAWGKGIITNIGFIIGGVVILAGWIAGNAPNSFNSYKMRRSRDEARNQQIRKEMKYTRGNTNLKP